MQANHMAVIYPTISPSSFEIPKPVLDLPLSLEETKPILHDSERSAAPCGAPLRAAAPCGAPSTSSNDLLGVTASLSTLARVAPKVSRSPTVMNTGPVSTAAASAAVTQQWPGLWGRLAKSFPPQSLERLLPLHDPRLVRQLQYAITVTGKPANALLDPGATHSFVKRSWVIEHSLQPTTLSSPSQVNSFNGQSTTLTQVLYAALGLGASSRAWAFYLVDQSPKDVVLGLDVMLQWPLFLDPTDGSIYFSSSQEKLALTRPIKASKPAKSAQFILQQALTTCNQPELSTAELPFLQDWMSSSQGDDFPPNFCTVAHSCLRPSSSFCPLPVSGSPHKAFSFSSPFSSPYVVPRLLSVTASGEAEEKEFTDFFAEASPQLQKVVKDHLSIFLPPDRDPPNRSVRHYIHVSPDAVPAARPAYPLGPAKQAALHEQMNELINKGWVAKSASPWAAPILFVAKDGGTKLRMCVDFRDLNALTKRIVFHSRAWT